MERIRADLPDAATGVADGQEYELVDAPEEEGFDGAEEEEEGFVARAPLATPANAVGRSRLPGALSPTDAAISLLDASKCVLAVAEILFHTGELYLELQTCCCRRPMPP